MGVPRRVRRRSRRREPWDDIEVIRAEIFGPDRFEQHAVSLADTQRVVDSATAVTTIVERVAEDEGALLDGYRAAVDDVRNDRVITPAANWLVENFHIVEQSIRQIRVDLPVGFYRQLPKLGSGFLQGHPRILGIVWGYVAHTDSLFDADMLARYIRAYETRQALTLGELWATGLTLRFLLIENLRRLADRVSNASADREAANYFADAVLARDGLPAPSAAEPITGPPAHPSRAFAVQLILRLRDQPVTEATAWLAELLDNRNVDTQSIVDEEVQAQTAATVTIRNIIASLRALSDVDWEEWIEGVSVVESELQKNSGYAALNSETRNLYRSQIEVLARRAKREELDVARRVARAAESTGDSRANDIGFWLIDEGRAAFGREIGERPAVRDRLIHFGRSLGIAGYLTAVVAVTVLVTAVVLALGNRVTGGLDARSLTALGLLSLIPLSDIAVGIVNYWVPRHFRATILPGLELRDGVPEGLRTLVAVPALLTSAQGVDQLIERLEVHHLANDHGEIFFALVSDWADSPSEHAPGDRELLERARDAIGALNARYDNQFLLLHRRRRYNAPDDVWMGWERKRGKLHELNRLLRGAADTSFAVIEGDIPLNVRYVLTLDSDTRLPRDTVRRLVAKIGHPLNRPVFEPAKGRVTRGYGVLQPRVTPSLPMTETSSLYQRIFSTPRGLDPYVQAVSDVYQDLFAEGSFAGKGIYDVDAMEAAGGFPENSLLSHDLLEGNVARSGLVTDVEVIEDAPMSYEVAASRTHRWARGDWQLLPWLLSPCPGLTLLGRWKMLDNLRRSVVPIVLVGGFIAILALMSARAAAGWVFILVAGHLLPPLLPALGSPFRRRRNVTRRSQVLSVVEDARHGVTHGAMNLILLAHHSWSMTDAIVRTMFRLLISRKRLLQWTTADQAALSAQATLGHTYRWMRGGLVPPALTLAVASWRGPQHLAVAGPLVLMWLAAPAIVTWSARPRSGAGPAVSPSDLGALRAVGRRTWQFFLTFVGSGDNHLPPDNFQEDPTAVIAHRTSPTNIGLYLLAVVSAHDFGWIGIEAVVDRLEATMASVASLERYRGHLFNWYETTTLVPLEPRYVSTVDSGNFAGHLIAVANACAQWRTQVDPPRLRDEGIVDAAALLRQSLDERRRLAVGAPDEVTKRLEQRLAIFERLVALSPAKRDAGRHWVDLADHAAAMAEDAARLDGSDGVCNEVALWAVAIVDAIDERFREEIIADDDLRKIRARLGRIESIARRLVEETDFSFLYDGRRNLFSIGFRVAQAQKDESCYDLLASEANLASFVAIAKGDVPTRHWFLLGRSVVAVGTGAALASWSGSMFEYLMPRLVMRAPAGGMLDRTGQLVVQHQIAYGTEQSVPWGISESAFNARDIELTYQYSHFGVPDLGLSRGLADNLVVAPYATGLAAMIDPTAAALNYARLARMSARGPYGYYEALDFTPSRVRDDETYAVVRCYMAHHQAMTIVALADAIFDGVTRNRFHAEPMVKATELLLQERASRDVPITYAPRADLHAADRVRSVAPSAQRRFAGVGPRRPTTQHISNGRLTLTLTPSGGGQLRWGRLAITRWRPDRTSDDTGDYIYLRDDESGEFWSATRMPTNSCPDEYDVRFAEDRAEYVRRDGTLTTQLDISVSPESDALVRRLTIHNRGRKSRDLTTISYAELVLATAEDDNAHPAFSKMFIHTEFLPSHNTIVANRRRRSPSDPEVWVAHTLFIDSGAEGQVCAETDRGNFLGRSRSARDPIMLHSGEGPSGAEGYVLDPVASLTQRVRVAPGARVRAFFWTFVAASRQEVLNLVDRHQSRAAYYRVRTLAWTQSQVQMRHLCITGDDAGRYQTLAGHVAYPHPALRPDSETLRRDAGPQSTLWSQGISGDLPIVLVRIDDPDSIDVVREVFRAWEYWRLKQFAVDLVVVNDRVSSYVLDLQATLEAAATETQARSMAADLPGKIFVLRRDLLPPDTLRVLPVAARAVIHTRHGDVAAQLKRIVEPVSEHPRRAEGPRPAAAAASNWFDGSHLLFNNGYGGFNPDGREYVTILDEGRPTPAPWTNVVANEDFGFHATAEGAGYTWWRNSRDNQLTPWRNDPVSTPISEAVYVREDRSGALISPTFQPEIGRRGRYVARHGFGYSRFQHQRADVALDLVQFVALDDPIKISILNIRNLSSEPRNYTVSFYGEFVLGADREQSARTIVTSRDKRTGALFVTNPWSTQFPDQTVFLDFGGAQDAVSGDRTEVLGEGGSPAAPAGLTTAAPLSGRVGAGMDPCGAMQQRVVIPAGGSARVVMLLGAARDDEDARTLIAKHREADVDATFEEVVATWRRRLGAVQVRTPDPSFDVMMNGWLLYQTLACRMLARSGYYQASGAFGFRDQLQDSMAVVMVDPAIARAHLLRAASRQFAEGDVQHWWLPETGMGVRTRISDDVVWLAHAAARYVSVTGDVDVLSERVAFLEGQQLLPDEHELFAATERSSRSASLYHHCVLGLERAFTSGEHGLPLMGTGDWNDGMNRVGAAGRGESVWLAWFLHATLSEFVGLARLMGDDAFAERCVSEQDRLLEGLEDHGWDGAWYRRGYFDDGSPLGSAQNEECRIDTIAQSWAVLSGAARPERAEQAMAEMERQLVAEKDKIVRLFTPPFDLAEPDPGYIRAYPPGVRENGGQYTHGALWSIFAYAKMKREDKAAALFSLVNPINHARTPEQVGVYRTEPYVVAADIYSVEPHVGRGGWTWYTGSSAWMYRAGLEAILGLRREGESLVLDPCLPPDWTDVSLRYLHEDAVYDIAISASGESPRSVSRIELDGLTLTQQRSIPLDARRAMHTVKVILSGGGAPVEGHAVDRIATNPGA